MFEVENTGQAPLSDVRPLDFGPKINGIAATGSLSAIRVTSGTDADADGDVDSLAAGEIAKFEADFNVSAQDISNAKALAVALKGGLERNDRYGLAMRYQVSERLMLDADASTGTTGDRARFMVTYKVGEQDSYYAGYEFEKGEGDTRGTYIVGGTRKLGEKTTLRAETRSDMLGDERESLDVASVEYEATSALRIGLYMQAGRVVNETGQFDRKAFSLGVTYDDGQGLRASVHGEYRQDRGEDGSCNRDADVNVYKADLSYEISPSARLLAKAVHMRTRAPASNTSIPQGDYTRLSFGYAFRPVDHDRLNVLAKVTHLDDQMGQTLNGNATGGDKQRSTVVSVDADYDLNENWSIGGKIGYRRSEMAPAGTSVYSQNDAGIAVARVTYHDPLDWDLSAEYRVLESYASETRDRGFVVTAYRHINENVKLGVGYNLGRFSDDLLDTSQDHRGLFLNLVAKF